MNGKITNFFPGANTCRGFYSLFEYLPYKTEQVYIMKGGPGTGKSTFMKRIGEDLVGIGFDIEKHRCASDPDSLDGLRIPALSTAFLDGTAPHTVDPVYPGVVEEIINLGRFWDTAHLVKEKENIIELNKQIHNYFKKAYHYLNLTNLFKNEIENLYQENYNANKTKNIKKTILEEIPVKNISKSQEQRHLFASGITPGGLISHYENITKNCRKRFLINGPSGTGKSNLIKSIAITANNYGYEVLYLHCSLNPKNLDSLVIPELNLAIINNCPPHTVKQNSNKDTVINIMEYIDQNINHGELEELNNLFKRYTNKAIKELEKEIKIHDELEKYYVKTMDFEKIEKIRKNILQEILNTR